MSLMWRPSTRELPPLHSRSKHDSYLTRRIDNGSGIGQLSSSIGIQDPWHVPRLNRLQPIELWDPRSDKRGILIVPNA